MNLAFLSVVNYYYLFCIVEATVFVVVLLQQLRLRALRQLSTLSTRLRQQIDYSIYIFYSNIRVPVLTVAYGYIYIYTYIYTTSVNG